MTDGYTPAEGSEGNWRDIPATEEVLIGEEGGGWGAMGMGTGHWGTIVLFDTLFKEEATVLPISFDFFPPCLS